MNCFISRFEGGEVFRPAHIAATASLFPSGTRVGSDLSQPEDTRVIENAVKWAALGYPDYPTGYVRPLSPVGGKIIK